MSSARLDRERADGQDGSASLEQGGAAARHEELDGNGGPGAGRTRAAVRDGAPVRTPRPSSESDPASEAEPERDWGAWLDGRARRLKRGRDYTGDSKVVVKRAREAAEGLGKLAVVSRDSQGKYDYVWIQFVDGEVEPGRPCPVCGGSAFAKVQKFFLRCHACASVLKASDEWEVAAGEYVAPTPAARTEAMSAPDAEVDEHGGEEYAQILGARMLSTDGREITGTLVNEDFVLHIAFRFLRRVDYALPRVRFSVEGAEPVLRVQPPKPLRPRGPATVDARMRVPANLLMPRVYSVELVLLILPDRHRPTEYLRVTATDVLVVRVRKIGGRSILDATDGPGLSAPSSPFTWDLEMRRDPKV